MDHLCGLASFLIIAGMVGLYFYVRHLANNELRKLHNVSWVCEVCGYDLRATRDRCPECGTAVPPGLPIHVALDVAKLSGDWPASAMTPRHPEPNEYPVLFYDTLNPCQAKLLAGQLQARGVAARVMQGKSVRLHRGVTNASVTYSKVVIWSEDISRAIEIAELLKDPASEAPDPEPLN